MNKQELLSILEQVDDDTEPKTLYLAVGKQLNYLNPDAINSLEAQYWHE